MAVEPKLSMGMTVTANEATGLKEANTARNGKCNEQCCGSRPRVAAHTIAVLSLTQGKRHLVLNH